RAYCRTPAATLDCAAWESPSRRACVAEPGDDPVPNAGGRTLAQVAARAGVSPRTVRRWIEKGLVPGYDGRWTPAAAAYVRVVARLRACGHMLEQIKSAYNNVQLGVGLIE